MAEGGGLPGVGKTWRKAPDLVLEQRVVSQAEETTLDTGQRRGRSWEFWQIILYGWNSRVTWGKHG